MAGQQAGAAAEARAEASWEPSGSLLEAVSGSSGDSQAKANPSSSSGENSTKGPSLASHDSSGELVLTHICQYRLCSLTQVNVLALCWLPDCQDRDARGSPAPPNPAP